MNFTRPVGIHIRRTDNTRCINDSPDHLFESKIRKIINRNPKQTFFLCTDDDTVRRKFIELFGERLFSRTIRSRYSIGGIEDGVIDMFLLSKCRIIYGCQSGFAKVASAIGGIDLNILKTNP